MFAQEARKPEEVAQPVKVAEPATYDEAAAYEVVSEHTDDEIMGFLRSMLHEIRQKRHEMVTHQNVDDLLAPLGFSEGQAADDSGSTADDEGHPDSRPNGPPDPKSSPENP